MSASEYIKKYENGKIHIEVELKNSLKHGYYKEYYRNGNIKISGKFKKGIQVGTWKSYDKKNKDILFKKRF
ncbi:MAG TPA: hypothetical protein DDY16_01345 [Tenacibaculum sp.]|nr:hypothetical protein [Tenacibaculum sp.]